MDEEIAGGGPVLPIGRLGVNVDVPDSIEEEAAAGDVDMKDEKYRCVAVVAAG
jgi:hypothetical protein